MNECQHVNSQQLGGVDGRGRILCCLFTKCADGLSLCRAERAATARNSPRCWTCCRELHNFLSTLATFQCQRKTKRWSDGCWLAAFGDRDEGFVLGRSAPQLLRRHCSASSHSRNVTAKSVKPQQRPLLFFNTVEVKLVKEKKKKKVWPGKQICHFWKSTLQSLLLSVCIFFYCTEKSHWQKFHLPFTILTFFWWQPKMDDFWDVR